MGKISFGYRNLRRVIGLLHMGVKIDPVFLVRLRPRPFRLKTDLEPRPCSLGVLLKCPGRGHASAAFQTRDDGLRGLHTLRYLLLGKSCAGAGFDQRGGKRKLFLQRLIFAPVLRVLHPLTVEIIGGRTFAPQAKPSHSLSHFCNILRRHESTIRSQIDD